MFSEITLEIKNEEVRALVEHHNRLAADFRKKAEEHESRANTLLRQITPTTEVARGMRA